MDDQPDLILVPLRQKRHRIHIFLYKWYETSGVRTEDQLQLFGSLLIFGAALIHLATEVVIFLVLLYGIFLIIGVFAGYVVIK
jgi:hypothetical protein